MVVRELSVILGVAENALMHNELAKHVQDNVRYHNNHRFVRQLLFD